MPLNVWLVEDSATDAFVIGEVLKVCGFRFALTVLTDGDAALNLLHQAETEAGFPFPNLVLLDLNLPKVPGIGVLAALRTSKCCSKVPIVVVTSSDSAGDMQAIFQLGATSYFRKPHNLDAFMSLSQVIDQALTA